MHTPSRCSDGWDGWEGLGGPTPPPPAAYFSTKMRPEGPKNIFFGNRPLPPPTPPLSEGLDRRLRCAIQRKTPVIDHPKCK